MLPIRQPAVADRFYPGDPSELHATIAGYLRQASQTPPPRALIVPHAGYIYSGPIAATAYASLAPVRDRIHRVVLLGPSHRVPFAGLAVSAAAEFATPLGRIPLDRAAIAQALTLPQVQTLEAAHADEHSLEVQLPFLQETLNDFTLVPFVVGAASAEDVAEVLELFWDAADPGTLIVVSSDLSHYHGQTAAQRLDAATSAAIEALRPDDISDDQACGRYPIRGLLTLARRHGLRAKTLDLRNSGDTAGSRDQVVGYGAYAFY